MNENSFTKNPDTGSIYRIQDIVTNVNPSKEFFEFVIKALC